MISKMHKLTSFLLILLGFGSALQAKPNVILIMADDLGWGDTGYNGNKVIKTPHLDQMSKDGLQMDRFYSASSVCSPTRASCLTGRSPYRTGVFHANQGILRPEEVTIPEILKTQGYTTGHFGKWHLGTLTTKERDSNRGKPGNTKEYNPPKLHGYDEAFVTEAKVPTWDPMKTPARNKKGNGKNNDAGKPYGTYYWDINGKKITDNLDGDDSRVIMDRVIPFIDKAVENKKPFFSVVWFHTPHLPCVAGPDYLKMYKDYPEEMQHYAGCVTAMDEQIGRLRQHLKKIGADQNTMVWFCSDNGPEGSENGKRGTALPFKGRKRDLYEGGVRVPGLLVWPEKIKQARKTSMPCVTYDYMPTILDALGIKHPESERVLDGVSLMPMIEGKTEKRNKAYGLMFQTRFVLANDQYKLISYNKGNTIRLFDMLSDKEEKFDIAGKHPEKLAVLFKEFKQWYASVKESFEGKEYGKESFSRLKQTWKGPYKLK